MKYHKREAKKRVCQNTIKCNAQHNKPLQVLTLIGAFLTIKTIFYLRLCRLSSLHLLFIYLCLSLGLSIICKTLKSSCISFVHSGGYPGVISSLSQDINQISNMPITINKLILYLLSCVFCQLKFL